MKEKKRFLILLLCSALLFSLCPQSVFAKADITTQGSGTDVAAGNPAEQEQVSDEGKDSALECSDNSVHTAENSVSGNDAALHNAEKEVMPLAEDGDYIAEAVADGYTSYVYKMKTVDEILSNISSGTNYKTVVFTMLKDVELTETLKFSKCYTNVVLDLNGKTLSGDLEDTLFAVDYGFISETSLLIKNGTIRNTGNGAALRLVDGKTMLKDVDVNGDIIFTGSFITYKYHMPVFFGGGTFSSIKMDSGYSGDEMVLSDMLEGEGWYFADADSGEKISRDCLTAAEPLENVTIKPCNHKNPDGSSAFEKINTSSGLDCKCSICGNLCTHKQVEDNQCQDCSLEIAAKWYYTLDSGKNIEHYTEYFTSFYKAMEAASIGGSNHTITLLRDQESSACDYEIGWHNTAVDFNGFTLKQNSMEIKRGTVIFQNTGSTAGHYQGTVSVRDNTFNGTLRVDAKNLIIDRFEVGSNGNAELRGGTFGTIVIDREDMTLADLLAENYYYADSAGNPIVTGNSDTELEDVTVMECKHDGSMAISIYNKLYDRNNWFCPCGKVTFAASVSKDGNTLYYEDMQNALDKAPDGSTVRFLSFIDIEDKFTIPNDVIIDLTDSDYFFYSGYDTRLTVKGTVTLVSAGNTSAGSIEDTEFDIKVYVQSGGKLIVPEQYDENTQNRINYTGNLTVEDGGIAQLDGGSYKTINPENGGEVVISGGSCSYFNVADGSKVTITGGVYENLTILGSYEGVKLSGGSFKEIIIREYNWDNGTSRTVAYADFAALLDSGRAFQKEDNTYVGKDDVKDYTSVPAKFIENVTIIDSPIQNLTAYSRVSDKDYKEPVSVQYGMQSGKEFSLRSEIRFRTDANPSANYQWYQIDSEGSWTKIENATKEIYDISSTMSPGAYTYVVEAENDGCICYSKPYTVTIIPRVLSSIMVDRNTLTRVYDGTKDTDFKVVGFYDSTGEEISLLNEDDFRLDQAMYNDPSVGEGGSPSDRCIEYEITLLNPNYAFDLQESMTLKGSYDAYITKAEAPVAASGMLIVANNQEAEYRFDFKTLLPEAPVGNYGTITYTLENGDIQLDDYYIDGAVLADGVLTLPIQKVDSTEENQVGTVTVTVKTQNYEDITLTLAVSAANENGGSTGGNENGGSTGGNEGKSDVEENGDSEKESEAESSVESNVADGKKETAADEKKVLQAAEGARPGRENSTSVAPVSTMVSMLEGEGQKWENGSEEIIRFRSSAAFEEFLKVLIDEKEVDLGNYLVYEGSTIVELKPDYLELLSEGEHTISIVSKSGTATAAFVIAKGKEADASKDNESIPPQDAESRVAQEKEPDAVPISNGSSSQSTESRSYGVIGGALLCIGGIVIAASVVYRKRKK